MAARLTRDVLIQRALNMLDSPRLDDKCRAGVNGPDGAITDPSLMTQWFQDGLDLFYHLAPTRGRLTNTPVTFTAGVTTYALPSDYILDYRDGVRLDDTTSGAPGGGRLSRRGMSHLLDYAIGVSTRRKPGVYSVQGSSLEIRPEPDQTYTGKFWYYALPAVAVSATVPDFPNDYLMIEYLQARGKEWLREVPIGSGNDMLKKVITQMISNGMMQEAEEDQIRLDRAAFPGALFAGEDPTAWMGKPSL